MAMFELKDSEDTKITNCHTDDPVLIKGEGLDRLEVADSSAFSPPSASPKRTIVQFLIENLFTATLGLVMTVIGGYLIFRFGWTG